MTNTSKTYTIVAIALVSAAGLAFVGNTLLSSALSNSRLGGCKALYVSLLEQKFGEIPAEYAEKVDQDITTACRKVLR